MVAAALVSFIIDCTKSIAASAWTTTPLGQIWFEISPSSLNGLQAGIQRNLSPFLWDPVAQTILLMPPWTILGPLGLLCLWFGDRKRRVQSTLI